MVSVENDLPGDTFMFALAAPRRSINCRASIYQFSFNAHFNGLETLLKIVSCCVLSCVDTLTKVRF